MGEFDDASAADAAAQSNADEAVTAPDAVSAARQDDADDSIAAIQAQLELDEPAETDAPEQLEPADPDPAPVSDTAEQPAPADAPDAPEEAEDDLAAAVAAATEQLGVEEAETTPAEEIASPEEAAESEAAAEPEAAAEAAEEPQPVAVEDAEAEAVAVTLGEPELRYGAPWWPFLTYLALWFCLAGVAIWQFREMPAGTVFYESQTYLWMLFGGLALSLTGIFLIGVVWLASRASGRRHRSGLFVSALVKGSLVVLIGVIIWWGTLMALDYLRLGRII